MDHAAGAEKRFQVQRAHGSAIRVVVQRRIGMGAYVWRQRDRADVDRAVRPQRRAPALLVGGVAGKHRAAGVNRR